MEAVQKALIDSHKQNAKRRFYPLIFLGILGLVAIVASFAGIGSEQQQVVMQAVGAFLIMAALILAVAVNKQLKRRKKALELFGQQPSVLERVHFTLANKRKKQYTVMLRLATVRAYFKLPEGQFLQVQEYFLETFPDITPTTLKRKMERKAKSA